MGLDGFFKREYMVINCTRIYHTSGTSKVSLISHQLLGPHFLKVLTDCKATHLIQPCVVYRVVQRVKVAVGTLDWEEEELRPSPGPARFSLSHDP